MEIFKVVTVQRIDLKTTQEEAHVIFPQQAVDAATWGSNCTSSSCKFTAIHCYGKCSMTCTLLSETTSNTWTVNDVGVTTREHSHITCQLVAAHTLTGCDTFAFMGRSRKSKRSQIVYTRLQTFKELITLT